MKINKTLLSAGILAGTIIGAGVFSLPYVFKTAGFASGFFYLILAAVAYIAIYLMYSEIILRTSGEHRFVGYTKIYLGKNFSWLAIFISIVQLIFVLTIYLILSQSFANLITGFGQPVQKIIIFWFLGSASIFLSLRKIAWLEFLITAGMVAIILMLFIFGLPKIGELPMRINFLPNWANFLLPFAPILFSLSGRVAIPEVVKSGGSIKKSIVLGVAVPAIAYALFVLAIIALSPNVSEDAVSGLVGFVAAPVLVLLGFLGIFSLISSYITVGLEAYSSLRQDLGFPDWLRFFLIIFFPIALYLAGFTNFLGLISFVGGIFLALEGIFIIAMWLRATNRKLSLPIILLGSVFVIALVYEIIK